MERGRSSLSPPLSLSVCVCVCVVGVLGVVVEKIDPLSKEVLVVHARADSVVCFNNILVASE